MSAPDERSCYACDMTAEGVCAHHRLADAAPALLAFVEKFQAFASYCIREKNQLDLPIWLEEARAAIQAAKGATP